MEADGDALARHEMYKMRLSASPYVVFFLLASAICASAADAASALVRIHLESDTTAEREAREQLQRILENVDLQRWLFTSEVRIAESVIPHSHPILTVSTDYLHDDEAQAAMFIHEQLHWFLAEKPEAVESSIADLRALYPEVPVGRADGSARSEYSTYLHLLVCSLEFDAVAEAYGETIARRVLRGWRHYRWIYAEVLERPGPIRGVLETHGLSSPDARTVQVAE